MGTVLQTVLMIVGFVLLIKGADIFVDASVLIAKRLNIPNVVIGLTVVAMGTSVPEAVVSISAALNGSNGLAIGNVVGSNIFNLLVVVGLCAFISPIAVRFRELARDYWISVGAALLLLVMMLAFGSVIPRAGGFLLFAVFAAYITMMVLKALKDRSPEDDADKNMAAPKPIVKPVCLAVLGIALIVAGGDITVKSAVNIAVTLGITERVIGLTVVAIGTSLPELVTSLVACRKGENDIAIGNVVGSNIFNILLVLGLSGIIIPLAVDGSLIFDLVILTASSLAFGLFAYTGKRIVRFEGFSMVMMYAAYMAFIIL
ncbi:MAG: calcium/sodium antiporter [Oscillospiraceae bacterium]|nr:calcium/sodium antiporter [Oscillospiraceae bacterium]